MEVIYEQVLFQFKITHPILSTVEACQIVGVETVTDNKTINQLPTCVLLK